MAENTDRTLIVGSEFDPSGFTAGLARSLGQYDEFSETIASRSVIIPPPEFDAREFTADVLAAAQRVRDDLAQAIDARGLQGQAAAAAQGVATQLETTLLERLGRLREQLATTAISPASFVRQAQLAVEGFNQEMTHLGQNLPQTTTVIKPKFDSGPFLEDIIHASDTAREELATAFDPAQLATAAGRAAVAAGSELQNQLLSRLGSLQDELAAELISPQAFVNQASAATAAYRSAMAELASTPIKIPPPAFDPNPLITEVESVSARLHEALLLRIDSRVMADSAAAAGVEAANALRATLEERLANLEDELALKLISPQAFAQQADLALEAFSREVQARADALKPLTIRTRIIPPDKPEESLEAWWQREGKNMDVGNLGGRGRGADNSLIELETQLKAVKADVQSGVISNNQYRDSLEEIRLAAIAMREQGLVTSSGSLTSFNRIMAGTEDKVKEGAVAMRQLRLGAAQLAVQATGTTGALGQLAQGILIFGGGTGLAIGVGLGLAAIAGAYDLVTQSARKLREEQDKVADSAKNARESIKTPQQQTGDIMFAILSRQKRAQEELAAIEARRNVFMEQMVFGWANAIRVQTVSKQLSEDQKTLDAERVVLARQLVQAETDRLQAKAAERAAPGLLLQDLSALLRANLKFNDSRRITLGLEQQVRAIADNPQGDPAERLRANQIINGVLDDRLHIFEREASLQAKSAQQDLTRLQRLEQMQGQFNQPLGVDKAIEDVSTRLEESAKFIQQNIDRVRELQKGISNQSEAAQDRLKGEEEAWVSLGLQITDSLGRLNANQVNRASQSVSLLTEQLQQAAEQAGQRGLSIDIPITLDTEDAVQHLQAIHDELQTRADNLVTGGFQVPPALKAELDALNQQLLGVFNAPFKALEANAQAIGTRLEVLRNQADQAAEQRTFDTGEPDTIGRQAETLRSLQPLVDELRSRYDQVTAAIARQGGPQHATLDLLQSQLDIATRLSSLRQPTPIEVTQLEPIQQAAEAYDKARQKFESATAHRLKPEAREASAEMAAAGRVLDLAADSTVKLVLALHLDAEVTKRILDEIEAIYGRIGRKAHEASADNWQKQLEGVGNVAGGIADTLQSVRDLVQGAGRDAGDALGNFIDLGHSIQGVGQAIARGDIFGAISSGINAIGSVGKLLGFGKSEKEKLLEQAQKDNTAALREATRTYREFKGQDQGVGGLAAQQDTLQRLMADPAARRALAKGDHGDTTDLVQAARDLGISWEELRRIGREFGISLEKDHNLVAGATGRLNDAMERQIQMMTEFGASLQEQTDRLNLQSRLFGEGPLTAQQGFQNQIDAGSIISPAIAQAFEGIDLQNEPQVRKALQDLFTKFDDGFFTAHPELFGGLSKSDFFDILNQGADYLDSFNQGLADATKQLGNVPDSFKLAAQEFLARPATGLPVPASDPFGGLGPNVDPGRLDRSGAGALPEGKDLKDLLQALSEGAAGTTIGQVLLNFEKPPDDPVKFGRDLIKALEDLNNDRFGNPNGQQFSATFTE